MPKGTKVELTGWYDNSANNPYNPDPNKEVHWGEQTTEEMMMGYFSYVVDPGQEIKDRNGRPTSSGGQQ